MMAHLVTTEDWIEAHREEWKQEGISIGEKQGKLEVARAMLAEKMPLDKITMFTGLRVEELKDLKY